MVSCVASVEVQLRVVESPTLMAEHMVEAHLSELEPAEAEVPAEPSFCNLPQRQATA